MKLRIQKRKWLIAVVAVALIVPALWGIAMSDEQRGPDTHKYRDPDQAPESLGKMLVTDDTLFLFGAAGSQGPAKARKPYWMDLNAKNLKRILQDYDHEIDRVSSLNKWYSKLYRMAMDENKPRLARRYGSRCHVAGQLLFTLEHQRAEYQRMLDKLTKKNEKKDTVAEDTCCFLPETEVVMADGSLKEIALIRAGDMVRSYNAQKGIAEAKMVLKTYTVVRDGYYLINGSLRATSTHRFLMAQEGEVWKRAKDLKTGDRIRSEKGDVAVKSIVKVEGLNTTHNFRIAFNHSYFVKGAGGLYVVHNGL